MARIFLSYSRESLEFVSGLVEDIEQLGHEVWYDRHLSGGQRWWDQILDQIRACDVFAAIVDSHSLASTACQRELAYADATLAPVLPIQTTDAVHTNLLPITLQSRQLVDYRARNHAAALRLARALASQPVRGPLPDPLPSPPDLPVSYLSGIGSRIRGEATLDIEQQKGLLFDLRRALDNLETEADARILISDFRRRPDLFSVIADKLDALLSEPDKSGPAPALPKNSPPIPDPPPEKADVVPRWRQKTPFAAHLRRALFGLVLGTAVGVAGMSTYPAEGSIWGGLTGLGLAFAFVVAGGRLTVIVLAVVFGAIGWAGYVSIDPIGTSNETIALATVFVLPPGLAAGALIGRFSSWLAERR